MTRARQVKKKKMVKCLGTHAYPHKAMSTHSGRNVNTFSLSSSDTKLERLQRQVKKKDDYMLLIMFMLHVTECF